MPRYVLLLQELLKNTEETHRDYKFIKLALASLKQVGAYVNERIRAASNHQKMKALLRPVLS